MLHYSLVEPLDPRNACNFSYAVAVKGIVELTTQQMLVLGKLDSLNSSWTVVTSMPHGKFATISRIELDIVDVPFIVEEDHVYLLELLGNSHSFQLVCANVSELLPITHSCSEITNAVSIFVPVLELFDAYLHRLMWGDHLDVAKTRHDLAILSSLIRRALTDKLITFQYLTIHGRRQLF